MARNLVTRGGKAAQIEGIPELQEKISAIINRATGDQVKKIWMQAALEMRDAARDYCPVAPGPITHYEKGKPPRIIPPGLLKSAIFAAYGERDKPDVLMGVNHRIAPHAHWLEFGNSRIPAQPYMRPAISLMRSTCVQIIADGYRKLLIEGGSISDPTSPSGNIPVPEVTEASRTRVRGRAKQIWQSKRGAGLRPGRNG